MSSKDRSDYDGDVFYDVWRSGGNPDRISYDRVDDHYWNGDEASEAAAHELRLQREAAERRQQEHELELQRQYEYDQNAQWERDEAERYAELERERFESMERFDGYGYYR